MNVGKILWNFMLVIVETMGQVKDILLTPYTVADIQVLGFTIVEGFTFTPLIPSAGFIIILLSLGIIKAVNPA